MINCKAITFALFSAVFAMSASASAEQLGLRSAVATPEASAEHASKARLTAFKQAEISLGNAISIAESMIGGIVIDANFQISNGRPAYVVKISLGWDHSVWQGMIDAQTGKVIGKGKTIPEDQLDQKDRSDLAGLHEWYAKSRGSRCYSRIFWGRKTHQREFKRKEWTNYLRSDGRQKCVSD